MRETTEVISVLKSNYVDRDKLNDKLLNEATVDGLIDALGHGAVIVTPPTPSTNAAKIAAAEPHPRPGLARAEVIDPNIGYIRLERRDERDSGGARRAIEEIRRRKSHGLCARSAVCRRDEFCRGGGDRGPVSGRRAGVVHAEEFGKGHRRFFTQVRRPNPALPRAPT